MLTTRFLGVFFGELPSKVNYDNHLGTENMNLLHPQNAPFKLGLMSWSLNAFLVKNIYMEGQAQYSVMHTSARLKASLTL